MSRKFWTPDLIWSNQPCYVIGGGPSLRNFDWEKLIGKNVIGCNVAYQLGPEIVPIIVFGDASFFVNHQKGLTEYVEKGGMVITNSGRVRSHSHPDWLKVMKKRLYGLGTDALGWNGNTGSAAINLALILGASNVYLLGYDMQLSKDGKGNYHDLYANTPVARTYVRFRKGMGYVAQDLKKVFPGCHIINLEDGTSALDDFEKQSLIEHFSEKKEEKDGTGQEDIDVLCNGDNPVAECGGDICGGGHTGGCSNEHDVDRDGLVVLELPLGDLSRLVHSSIHSGQGVHSETYLEGVH